MGQLHGGSALERFGATGRNDRSKIEKRLRQAIAFGALIYSWHRTELDSSSFWEKERTGMSADRSLAVTGVVIGLLGLIPIFRDASSQERILYTVALLLLGGLFIAIYRSGKGPQYSTKSMRKTLRFLTADGTRATFTRDQAIRVNYGSMDEIWCRNIVADGTIENVRVDGQVPAEEDQQTLGCLLDVRKRFGSTLYRAQKTSVCWTHDLINSFPDQREFIDHDVTPATDQLELIVELPEGPRKFRDAVLEERVAGEPSRSLGAPAIEQNGLLLHAIIRKPRAGRTIRMSWSW
jgi:hypothetical protein